MKDATYPAKWFFVPQRIFKEWKVKNKKASDCVKQTITSDYLEELHFIYPEAGGSPEAFTLHAYKHTNEVYLRPEIGEPKRIILRERNDLNSDRP